MIETITGVIFFTICGTAAVFYLREVCGHLKEACERRAKDDKLLPDDKIAFAPNQTLLMVAMVCLLDKQNVDAKILNEMKRRIRRDVGRQ